MSRTLVTRHTSRWLRWGLPMLVTTSLIGCHSPPATPPPGPLSQSIGSETGVYVADSSRLADRAEQLSTHRRTDTSIELAASIEQEPQSPGSKPSVPARNGTKRRRPAERSAVFEPSDGSDSWADPASFENARLPADSDRSAFPVDLPTVLRLTGSQNWAIQLAAAQREQAEAAITAAEALWLPNLNLGVGYTRHDGEIQATNGDVVQISRNSLFVGGGGKVANAPMTGSAGGPARFFVDLSLADALYEPLVARQMACAAKAAQTAEFNNAQLDAALAYFDLVSAQAEVAAVSQSIKDAENLLKTTQAFVEAGKAASGELSRVEVSLANLQQDLINARLALNLASNNLIRVVRLDTDQLVADTPLYSIETQLVPIQLVPDDSDLATLVAQGQLARPEVAQLRSMVEARIADGNRERMRPYLPNVNVSTSGGLFGGGPGSGLDDVGGRVDVDALLVWQVRNLGFGENAARRDREAQYQQAMIRGHQMKDRIAAEVRNAWHQVVAARQRMSLAQDNVEKATKLLEVNLDRIQGLEGLPIEAVQALTALADARVTQLRTIVAYNKAQATLLQAIGRPIENAALMASGPQ